MLAVLAIEDNLADFLLLQRHCKRDGLEPDWHRVEQLDQLQDAMRQRKWDLVISDFHVPGMEFIESYKVIRRLDPDLPVILVSGHVGEETAVQLMKLGVRDFLLKDNLNRLVPVITKTLQETSEVRSRREADAKLEAAIIKLKKSEEFQSAILNSAIDAIVTVTEGGLIESCNPAFENTFGFQQATIIGKDLAEVIIPPRYRAAHNEGLARLLRSEQPRVLGKRLEVSALHANGSEFPVEIIITYLPGVGCYTAFIHDISERKQAERNAERERIRLSTILKTASDGIHILDHDGLLVEASEAFLNILGYDDSVIGKLRVADWDAQDQWPVIKQRNDELIATRGRAIFETLHRRRDGSLVCVEISASGIEIEGKGYLYASSRDISDRKHAESEQRLAAASFESSDGMVISDANRTILRVNQAFTTITGYSVAESVGKSTNLLKSGCHDDAFYAAMWNAINREGSWKGEIWNRRKNGEIYPESLTITAVKDASGQTSHYVGTFRDITQRKAVEEQVKELAFFDPLTHLPNRRLLRDRLHQALAASSRHEREGALFFIDLDNFKTINDTQGHDQGDIMLQEVARRLTNSFREADTVARIGGDEFVVVLADLCGNPGDAAAQAKLVGEKVLMVLGEPYLISGNLFRITPSIGITLFGKLQDSIDELMKQADLAMYQAKAAGRNTLRFFDPDLQAAIKARASLETDLRRGIQDDQVLLYYQPQVDGPGRLTGAEALVRWKHPVRGLVSPAEFIPLAEESGLILSLGLRVLEMGCAQVVAWANQPEMAQLSLALNVSAKQFHQADFVEQLLEVVTKTGANPRRLKLELTESMLLENIDEIIAKMARLKEVGFSFSLDDFGTGYSSLSYLKRLPLSQLKIDQSFVRDILNDPNDAAIARTIVGLADSLGLGVIAEGVETLEQRDFLDKAGCHAYQGYFFSRPLPPDAFAEFAWKSLTGQAQPGSTL